MYNPFKQKDLVKPLLWTAGGIYILVFTLLVMANPKNDNNLSLPVIVKTLVVGSSPTLQSRSFSGRIQSAFQIDLSFNVSGQLIEYPVKEGQRVEQGQVIARLNPNEYRNTLDQEKTKLHQVSTRYNRAKNLIKTHVISQNDFNNIEKDFETLKHQVNHSSKTLDSTVLIAPFSGQINRKFVQNYQSIQANQPVVTLQDPNNLEILIEVPERVLPKTESAKKKLNFYAIFEDLPNKKIQLDIKSYGTKGDASVHTYPVLLSLPELNNVDLLPGMLVTVIAEYKMPTSTQEKNYQIPLTAIWIGENQKKYVWVVDPKQMIVQKRQIQVQTSTQQNMQIIQGLKKGEIIVTAGTHNLREGAKIKLYNQHSSVH